MQEVIAKIEKTNRKAKIPALRSGDIVRVHQKVSEGGKERVQVFEGAVIRVRKLNSLQANITVRRIASGVGVEKTFLLHSPAVEKVTIERRSKVRRNYLSYLRQRAGKSARMRERSLEELTISSGQEATPETEESTPSAAKTAPPAKTQTKAADTENKDASQKTDQRKKTPAAKAAEPAKKTVKSDQTPSPKPAAKTHPKDSSSKKAAASKTKTTADK